MKRLHDEEHTPKNAGYWRRQAQQLDIKLTKANEREEVLKKALETFMDAAQQFVDSPASKAARQVVINGIEYNRQALQQTGEM